VSDNTAANLLLARIGGPAGWTRFARQAGDLTSRLDRDEPTLNSNLPGDPRDTTTPRAMAGLLERVLTGDLLSPVSRGRLIDWLVATETGRDRLRAGLPPDWRVGDKTGTGGRGACNDVAVAWPPRGGPWYIAAYVSESPAAPERLNAAHAELGRMVAAQGP
jgi:beta-lactamase class A